MADSRVCRLLENFHMQFKTGPEASGTLPTRTGTGSTADTPAPIAQEGCPCNLSKERSMPKFVIEREIPGAGKMTPAELKTISKKSCGVLSSLGPSVHWITSYVTTDK